MLVSFPHLKVSKKWLEKWHALISWASFLGPEIQDACRTSQWTVPSSSLKSFSSPPIGTLGCNASNGRKKDGWSSVLLLFTKHKCSKCSTLTLMAFSDASLSLYIHIHNHFWICRCGFVCYLKSINGLKTSRRRIHGFLSGPSKNQTGRVDVLLPPS